MLTVLVQNEVPGLQVKVAEQWVDVEPVAGAIVINIGDILQVNFGVFGLGIHGLRSVSSCLCL